MCDPPSYRNRGPGEEAADAGFLSRTSMLRCLLVSVFTVSGFCFVVYFFHVRGDQGFTVEEEIRGNGSGGSSDLELTWARNLEEAAGRDSLFSLREKLAAKPRSEAVAEIEEYLKRAEDRTTGLEFSIGRDGRIEGWPTVRVFLLDLLLKIDPGAAALISRGILSAETSADEWAVALRNVAKGEGSGDNRDYLRIRTEELISNPEWQAQPSVGYLNAFDVLVYARATETLPLLSKLLRLKDRQDLAHAAFLTLDRLVQREPVKMLARLGEDHYLRQSRPQMTAQQFARADLRDATQRAIVKSWLLDTARTSTELENFSAIYPNNNKLISHNLLTSEEQVPGELLQAHDREELAVIQGWKVEPDFGSRTRYLEVMERRLSQFVDRANDSAR